MIIYWLGLAASVLAAVAVTSAMATQGEAWASGTPTPIVLGFVYLLPVLIGWRIWVHRRAQDRALTALENEMEKENV